MKKTLLGLAVVAAMAVGQSAYATTVTQVFEDTAVTWPGWNIDLNAEHQGYPEFRSTTVVTTDDMLQSIAFSTLTHSDWIKSGDLFLDTNSDQTWDYVVRSVGYSMVASGSNLPETAGFYAISVGLNDTDSYLLSTVGREGHPYALNFTPTDYVGAVGYSVAGGPDEETPYPITFDFSQLGLSLEDSFIIGYSVGCSNDVIYQNTAVPEPATFVMLGAGLLGLGLYGRRKKQL